MCRHGIKVKLPALCRPEVAALTEKSSKTLSVAITKADDIAQLCVSKREEKVILVTDLSSPDFRHQLVQERFITWTWQTETFGLQCKSSKDVSALDATFKALKSNNNNYQGSNRQKIATFAKCLEMAVCQGNNLTSFFTVSLTSFAHWSGSLHFAPLF